VVIFHTLDVSQCFHPALPGGGGVAVVLWDGGGGDGRFSIFLSEGNFDLVRRLGWGWESSCGVGGMGKAREFLPQIILILL
jgi:hypothetical protein